jgi:hypothetical protein
VELESQQKIIPFFNNKTGASHKQQSGPVCMTKAKQALVSAQEMPFSKLPDIGLASQSLFGGMTVRDLRMREFCHSCLQQ